MPLRRLTLAVFLLLLLGVSACQEPDVVILKPDELARTYEASEEITLKATASILRDKGFGRGVMDLERNRVESGYILQKEYRVKVIATTKKVSPRESELTLSVITEKQTKEGWQLIRMLGKDQYDTFFDAIEMQIYREMYRAQ